MMEPLTHEYDVLVKTVIVGDGGVGKTSFCKKLTTGEFSDLYSSTIGVDFFIKYSLINDKIFKLQIWDTAGQERFNSIITSYFKNAKFVILIFDKNDSESYEKIIKWHKMINNHCLEKVKILAIGNKTDLELKADMIKINDFFNEMNIPYIDMSVKKDRSFNDFEKNIHNMICDIKPNYTNFNIIELKNNKNNKLKCC